PSTVFSLSRSHFLEIYPSPTCRCRRTTTSCCSPTNSQYFENNASGTLGTPRGCDPHGPASLGYFYTHSGNPRSPTHSVVSTSHGSCSSTSPNSPFLCTCCSTPSVGTRKGQQHGVELGAAKRAVLSPAISSNPAASSQHS